MAELVVKITNTTSTTNQLKVHVKQGTYKLNQPGNTILTDLNAQRTRLSGAVAGKVTLTFTAAVKRTPDSGDAGLGTPNQTSPENLWIWCTPDSAAHAVLLVTDAEGTTRSMLMASGWIRSSGNTDGIAGATKEWLEHPIELQEQGP